MCALKKDPFEMLIDELLQKHRAGLNDDFVAALEAEAFVKMLQVEYPDDLEVWMTARTVSFITDRLVRMELRDRSRAINHAAFRDAFIDSDPIALSLFRRAFVVDAANTRRPLAKMTADDLQFVAGRYESSAKHDAAMSAFFNALATKVGDSTVEETLTEVKVTKLLRSFIGPKVELAA